MLKKTPPSRKASSSGSVLSSRLPRLGESWLLTCSIRECTERTQGNRRDVLARLQWFLEDRSIVLCDELALKQFFHYAQNGHKEKGGRWGNAKNNKPVKAGTVATYHRILRAFFNFLVKDGEIDTSPMEKIDPPINRPDQINPFSHDQIQRLLSAADRTMNPKRDKAILYVLLDCAIRVSELLSLTIGDVDFSRCLIAVRNGKGGKARYVPFSPETRRAVYEYLRERGDTTEEEALFLSDRGRTAGATLTSIGLQRVVKRIGKKAGITGVRLSPHTLRHTFAVEYLRNGGNQFALMNLLGHTSLVMTSNYVKIAQADLEQQHKQFSPVANLKRKAATVKGKR